MRGVGIILYICVYARRTRICWEKRFKYFRTGIFRMYGIPVMVVVCVIPVPSEFNDNADYFIYILVPTLIIEVN